MKHKMANRMQIFRRTDGLHADVGRVMRKTHTGFVNRWLERDFCTRSSTVITALSAFLTSLQEWTALLNLLLPTDLASVLLNVKGLSCLAVAVTLARTYITETR